MKKLRVCRIALVLAILMLLASCVMTGTGTPKPDKKKLTTAMGVYNSQYMQYMSTLGYIMTADGEWKQMREPKLSDEKKEVLRVKKEILTEMYSLIQLYDAMVTGTMPYSWATEQSLFNLIDQLAEMTGGDS
jgi:hypothetical protein